MNMAQIVAKHEREMLLATSKAYADGFKAGQVAGRNEARAMGVASGLLAAGILGLVAFALWLMAQVLS